MQKITFTENLAHNIALMQSIFEGDDTFIVREATGRNGLHCAMFFFDGMVDSFTINESLVRPVLLSDRRRASADELAGRILQADDCRVATDMEKALAELEAIQEAQKKAALPALETEPLTEEKVDFDTFCKSDFRAVKVKACEAVKKSDKLLRFTLDDGTGTDRQILSGIHKWYEPEQLIGKTAIAILNLPPRKMMGLESCGMLLSATHTEKGQEVLNLIMVDDKIPAGAKLC